MSAGRTAGLSRVILTTPTLCSTAVAGLIPYILVGLDCVIL